jgi:hypothetical protein
MKIVCSWCRREGNSELVGEKAPLDDGRETHGICVVHRQAVEARWRTSIHTVSYSHIAIGWSCALLRWTGLLSMTKKTRP